MVSARLQGGLCNVLFQIAAAEALALRNGDSTVFDLQGCYTPLQGNPAYKYRDTVLRNVRDGHFDPEAYYKEPSHTFSPIPYKQGLLIDGYFQAQDYFQDHLREIQELFVLNDFSKEVGNLTAIHVRRGDYLKFSNIHPVLPISYYNRAIELIGGKFIVVSDDMDWCIENIQGKNISYSSCSNEVDDLSILTSCRNVIGSNSSFSSMGFILNKNPNKIGIFPKVWFGPDGPDQSTIYPKGILKL